MARLTREETKLLGEIGKAGFAKLASTELRIGTRSFVSSKGTNYVHVLQRLQDRHYVAIDDEGHYRLTESGIRRWKASS